MSPIQNPKTNKRISKNPLKNWQDFNIDQRLNQINTKIKENDMQNLERDLNNIDQSISDSMRHAKRKVASCHKFLSTDGARNSTLLSKHSI